MVLMWGLLREGGKVDDGSCCGLYCPKIVVFHSNAKVARKNGGNVVVQNLTRLMILMIRSLIT